MIDTISADERSRIMSLVKGKNTQTEMLVRRLVHKAGFRYRLHDAKLPGKPDLVFSRKRKVIFVHGCFWHRHEGCPFSRMPKSNQGYWVAKLEGNKARDDINLQKLHDADWQTLVVWECELRDLSLLASRLTSFLLDEPPC
ncbi:TPA: very short patch repair endonuclease [Pseudomonas aeruginosa]|uniref:very short patch repair endonuclease n=1 Tax=Pseudomonas aeruginosa TaxID=287 RepID=UPI001068B748|nr:very short patch repair endonuclease [Pseudomonas aeruginosa]ELG5198621.1 DNA mismatch endonuclease Vsr [Pseudomonas aeruginosa]MBH4371018.1 DNA mismatch endonuclease Vsr [Pseudomonas aeruginosa]MBH9022201.1 DNA mismatch endonuclease Vsr [Pseudomonas aeruginosa]MBI7452275.1 DNA mismatch endonuclease Vsr [Pseudomonas aeruginosa]MBI7482359.1 DNA mismatch endonuclease Vsr [Pseudomonas aeruginosa]